MFEDVDEGHVDGETTVHYYYNRDERLKNAPQLVKDYYNGKLQPVKGFKVLFKNKSNLTILITLIFFVAFVWMYTGFNNSRNYAKIDGVEFELQAFSYGEEIFASIKASSKQIVEPPVPADVELFFINNDKQVVYKEKGMILFNKEDEYFRTKTTDYDIIRVDVIINYGGKEKEISSIIRQ